MDRNLQILGMAKKAGLIAVGGDAVSTAARNYKAKLVITAIDASEGAQRRARLNAEAGGAVYIATPYTKFEFGSMTGRGSPGTAAILDAGLAAGFAKGLAEAEPERYRKAAELLEENALISAKRTKKHNQSGKKQTPRRTAK